MTNIIDLALDLVINIIPNKQTRLNLRKKYLETYYYKKVDKNIKNILKISKMFSPGCVDEAYDRIFIEDFIKNNSQYIKGDVLEFCGFNFDYATNYSKEVTSFKKTCAIKHKDIFKADYYIDVNDKNTLPNEKYDCIIATNVFMYMPDLNSAFENIKSLLKDNGIMILTFPGISTYCPNSGHCFMFTREGVQNILNKHFQIINIKPYSSLKSTVYTLFSLKRPKNKNTDIDFSDIYPVIIGAVVKNGK